MLQQKNRKTGGKANSTFVSMLEQISTYCAPVVSLILWRNDTEVEIASREMQVKAFEANLSASLESAKYDQSTAGDRERGALQRSRSCE